MRSPRQIVLVLEGCDDSTELDMLVTSDEMDFLKNISQRSKKTSTYPCMPILKLYEDEREDGWLKKEIL